MFRANAAAVVSSVAIGMGVAAHAAVAPTSFIGAQGFGATSIGGRFGDVYHVTNLNDSGVGSLRYGIENAPSRGRTIVFDIGGWIDINSKLGVLNDKITIAGQTAPGGIGVRGDQFSIGADDIIIRHMRFRPGKGAGRVDAAGANIDANRIIYDHVSAGFSYDETFSTRADNLTLQYSSVSWGMEDHSAGSLIENGAGHLSFHHNVYAHNDTRNPKARAELMDWRDNVAYDYHNGFIAGDSTTTDYFWRVNFDGNTYVGGSANRPMMTGGRDWNYGLWFGENQLDADGDNTVDPVLIDRATAMGSQSIVSSAYTWETQPYAAPPVWQNENAAAAYDWTLDHFGATPWARDAVDVLTANNIRNRAGSRVSHENQLGIENAGYPTLGGVAAPTDTDGDGMSDEWELLHGLNPNVVNNAGDFDNDGYTDLEEYLTDLAPFPAPGVIHHVGGVTRYAEAQSWSHFWQPSPLDTAAIHTGTVTVDAVGQHAGTLILGPDAGDQAFFEIAGGWLKVADELVVGGDGVGVATLSGGKLFVDRLSKGATAAFVMNGGELHASEIAFDLTNQGGVIAPGSSVGTTTVLGDLALESGSVQIELDGVAPGAFDELIVTGEATFGGTLDVDFGYAPSVGDSFAFLTYGSHVGAFSALDVSGLTPDLNVVVNYGPQQAVLQVVAAAIAGDYDGDGLVAQGDLDLVLLNWGVDTAAGGVPAGWVTNLPTGLVDQAELDEVLVNWGGSAAPSGQAVPEPAVFSVIAGGCFVLLRR